MWEVIDSTTKRLTVPGGWLYWVRNYTEEPCMCFVPLVSGGYVTGPGYNPPYNPNDHVVTCGPATSVAR